MENEWIDCSLDGDEEDGWEYYYEGNGNIQQNKESISEQDGGYNKIGLDDKVIDDYDDIAIDEDNKLIVNDKFPQIDIEYIKQQCKNNGIEFIKLNKQLTRHKLRRTKKPTIFYILFKSPITKQKHCHVVFYDGEKIWDSWSGIYDKNLSKNNKINFALNQYKYYYNKKIYKNLSFFENNAPQQNSGEGYCALFSLANARLRAKNEKLETMDKTLQVQKMRDELSTFAEINSEMHVNGIQIFGL